MNRFWIIYLLLRDKVNDLHLDLRRMIFRRQPGPYAAIRNHQIDCCLVFYPILMGLRVTAGHLRLVYRPDLADHIGARVLLGRRTSAPPTASGSWTLNDLGHCTEYNADTHRIPACFLPTISKVDYYHAAVLLCIDCPRRHRWIRQGILVYP